MLLLAEDDFTPVVLLVPKPGGYRESRQYGSPSVENYHAEIEADFWQRKKQQRRAEYAQQQEAERRAWEEIYEAQAEPETPAGCIRLPNGRWLDPRTGKPPIDPKTGRPYS